MDTIQPSEQYSTPSPVAPQMPVGTPVTEVQPTKSPILIPIIIAIVATILLMSGIFYGLSLNRPQKIVVAPTPTPTPIATPTPIRQQSTIVTTPAFQQFSTMVATLSAAIAQFNQQDPTLTPPTLVLPLGFSN